MNFTSKRRRISDDNIDSNAYSNDNDNDNDNDDNIDNNAYSNDNDNDNDNNDDDDDNNDDDDDDNDDDDDDDDDDYYDYGDDADYDNESDSYEEEKFCIICDDNEVISSSFNYLTLKANDLYPSCHHSCHFCIHCIQRIVSDKIKQSALNGLVCPLPGCKLKFDHEFIKAVTTDDEYVKYQQDIMSLINGRRSFLNILSDFRSNALRGFNANCKRCPNCYYIIEKDGGCNHMQCRKCSFEFHWCCRQEWTPIHNEGDCLFYMYVMPLLYLFLSPLLLIIVYFGLSFFVFLGKLLYIMVYLLGVIVSSVSAIFILRLKDTRENAYPINSTEFKEFLTNLMIFFSILMYLTSDNIIASYIDLNENDGFRLLLLLPLFRWDTWDIYKVIYKYRSKDQIVNIMVSFIITYSTGSILCHTSYVIPYIAKNYKNLSIANRNVRVTMMTIAVVLEVITIIRTSNSIRTFLIVLAMLFSYLFIPFHYSQFSDVYTSMGVKRFRNDEWVFLFCCVLIGTTFTTLMYKPMNIIGTILGTILMPMISITRYIGLMVVPLLMTLLRFFGTIVYNFIWGLSCIQVVSKSDTTTSYVKKITNNHENPDYNDMCIMLKGWCTDTSFLLVTLVPFVYIAIIRYTASFSLYERVMNAMGIMILHLIFCQLGLIENNNTTNNKSKNRNFTALVKDRVNKVRAKIFRNNFSLFVYSQYVWVPLIPSLLNVIPWLIPILYVILLGLTLLGPLYYLTYIR